jgi:cytochrome P450
LIDHIRELQGEASMTRPLSDEARLDDIAFYGQEPHTAYTRLRREAPVFYYEPGNFWALSKWADIRFVGMSPHLFSSEGPLFISEWRYPELLQARSKPMPDTRPYFTTDPPVHAEFRRQINRCLTRKALTGIEAASRRVVQDSLKRIPDGEVVEVVEAISIPTPILVIADLLGVPRADRDHFVVWSNAHIALRDADPASERGRKLVEQSKQLLTYMSEIQKDHEQLPQDCLMAHIARITVEGQPLSPGSQALVGYELLIAGNETIRSAISGALLALVQHPDQWLRLREDPSLAVTGADEVLRWTTPAIHFGRTATADVEIRDKTIRRGEFVAQLFDAGNRDEETFEAGDCLDIGRKHNPHLSFGYGEHFCPGINLARLELQVVLEELARSFRGWELAGVPVRPPSMITNSTASLPLIFRHN